LHHVLCLTHLSDILPKISFLFFIVFWFGLFFYYLSFYTDCDEQAFRTFLKPQREDEEKGRKMYCKWFIFTAAARTNQFNTPA
jgi:hypothetical protein